MKRKTALLITLVVYVLSAVSSFAVFSNLYQTSLNFGDGGSQTSDEFEDDETALGALLQISSSDPRDQVCPLSGQMYTLAERQAWEQRRPLAVMIENSPDARPQSGLADADIMFEIIAEGGVTRFMGIFYCGVQRFDTTLAPIRSARTYFVDYASGFNFPLYTHVGGANLPGPTNALGQISDYGWALQNNINQFSVGFPTFVRNANRLGPGKSLATEHTMETTTEKLWAVAEGRGWTNMSPARRIGRVAYEAEDWKDGYTPWTFQDEVPAPGKVTTVKHAFWSGYKQYEVEWTYNPTTNAFQRKMGGEAHIDLNSDKQIEAANVVVLLTTEKGPINELKHMIYTTTGAGDALIFKNGAVEKAKWVKKDRQAQLQFVDSRGRDVEMARGLTWISVVNSSTKVDY
jgi:hypothetical protein